MQPIHELLNRIRWDRDFGRAAFEIGYYDRVEGRIVRVPFAELAFPPEDRQAFELLDRDGNVRLIPFHRVREVYRDGQCIWLRKGPR